MRLGIVIFPTKDLQDRANSYRKRYDPHYKLISPHLTLTEAFDTSDADLNRIIDHLTAVSKQVSPFQFQVNKVSHFHPTNNVIYFAVQDSPELVELYNSLHSVEQLQHERPYAFVPHITIGQKLPSDELHDIYARLRTEKLDYSVPVKEFHLVHQLENKTWSVYQSFTLSQ